jgi:hypothetical protein
MDKEFHYYITNIIALRAGFNPEDAQIIAYSSQYVDDNTMIFEINSGNDGEYKNYISQTMNILKPEKIFYMRIYPIFHFFPGHEKNIMGDSARRCDGKLHLLNTIPDNQNANELLQAAFESKNLYRIGIATHTYSDTFAHQNFVGYYDAFNSMEGLLEKALPDIGHADAMHQPDWPALNWVDTRLIKSHAEVDNKKRFLEAVGRLFEEYRRYLNSIGKKTSQNKKGVIAEIDKAIGGHDEANEQKDVRIGRYKAIIGNDFIDYDENRWFNDAVRKRIGFFKWNYSWRDNYKESHWYKFQEAVKEHQKIAKDEILKLIFEKMDLRNL